MEIKNTCNEVSSEKGISGIILHLLISATDLTEETFAIKLSAF